MFYLYHVQDRDALADAHNQAQARICRFNNRVRRKRGRHKHDRNVGAGGGGRVRHGIEDRYPLNEMAGLARRDASYDPGAVIQHLTRVKRALGAGNRLHNHAGFPVDKNAH